MLISASAIGYYGDRGEEVLTEESAPGAGFLAEVCRQWEAATLAACEMANELLLASARVQPEKLLSSGYLFRYPKLAPPLKQLLSAA